MSEFQKGLDEILKSAEIVFEEEEIVVPTYDPLRRIKDDMVKIRKEKNISQKKLAEITGISQANISKIENGYYIPSIEILKRIADAFEKKLIVEFSERMSDNNGYSD